MLFGESWGMSPYYGGLKKSDYDPSFAKGIQSDSTHFSEGNYAMKKQQLSLMNGPGSRGQGKYSGNTYRKIPIKNSQSLKVRSSLKKNPVQVPLSLLKQVIKRKIALTREVKLVNNSLATTFGGAGSVVSLQGAIQIGSGNQGYRVGSEIHPVNISVDGTLSFKSGFTGVGSAYPFRLIIFIWKPNSDGTANGKIPAVSDVFIEEFSGTTNTNYAPLMPLSYLNAQNMVILKDETFLMNGTTSGGVLIPGVNVYQIHYSFDLRKYNQMFKDNQTIGTNGVYAFFCSTIGTGLGLFQVATSMTYTDD